MFADEARFGRINRPRPCWAPIGTRPAVASQLIREYIYLYGAVSPKDGICVYLIMPTSNTACFQAFLNVLSRKFARQDILLVLDGAPNHRCGYLALPDNISLLFLPPYSPELNPKENLWDEIREKIFKNYALKSIDAVRAKLKQAILYIERNPKIVQSITSFPYIASGHQERIIQAAPLHVLEERGHRLGIFFGARHHMQQHTTALNSKTPGRQNRLAFRAKPQTRCRSLGSGCGRITGRSRSGT